MHGFLKLLFVSSVYMLVLSPLAQGAPAKAAKNTWYRPPFKLQVGGVPLDTADRALGGLAGTSSHSSDDFGHAAPFLIDMDGDGRRDLVVGSFGGRFRLYRNTGADAAPVFPKDFVWLKGGENPAQVPIYCCVASGPQLVDIDRDGILDLTAGSYDPGVVYWFKGFGKERFSERHMLTTATGLPLFTPEDGGEFVSNVAWADWDADGLLDMLVGNGGGRLFLRLNQERFQTAIAYTPFESQPTFYDQRTMRSMKKPQEILIDGSKAVAEEHLTPGVADWDGDGLWDILAGTHTGAVYWFRNTGKPGEPEFRTRQPLISPGEGADQFLETGESPRRGIRSQIHAVDYNLDGKLDLLVGDWSWTLTPRTDLTARERREMQAVRARLAALDKEAGYDGSNLRNKCMGYALNPERWKQSMALEMERAKYMQAVEGHEHQTVMKAHGHVWVFLRR